jgi:hypothetical protein
MGYHVSISLGQVIIREENVGACLAAINSMFTNEKLSSNASGGCFGPGMDKLPVKKRFNYSWVNNPGDDGFRTLQDAINAWRYSSCSSDDGDGIQIDYFNGDKWGDDEQFFDVIAPFVESGATIECIGEDDDHWRYVFENGQINMQEGRIVYENEEGF